MAEIKLSILIPTTPDRRIDVLNLLGIIESKYYVGRADVFNVGIMAVTRYYDLLVPIEIIVFEDDKIVPLGEKRELMYKYAKGYHSLQLDSDDSISDKAIALILKAIEENPDVDCITFEERCDMNGEIKTSNHALKYEKWQDNFDGFDYVRCPFYKDVIKTSIARSVPFPHIRYNEDEQWSMALRPHLNTECHIYRQLYYYSYYPKESHEERYGINRNP